MKNPLSRRRFLAISAASMACTGLPLRAAEPVAWKGRAMGAEASMVLTGPITNAAARSVFRAVEQELARLERIFSLYQANSQIVQLNRAGVLRAPAPEFLEVLSLCATIHAATKGAFDPTVQPLWLAHATAPTRARAMTPGSWATVYNRVGWSLLRFDESEIRFDLAGCALTLNGIAQGYVTDRVAALLRQHGLTDILIDMGEIAALGAKPWQVGIATPDGALVDRITLRNRAIATSAPSGTLLAPDAGLGHILDPRDAGARPKHRLISVSANSAAVADGLSTAFCLMNQPDIDACLSRFTDARLETSI